MLTFTIITNLGRDYGFPVVFFNNPYLFINTTINPVKDYWPPIVS